MLDPIAELIGDDVTEAGQKTWFTTMRAALAGMGDPMGRAGSIQNLSLSFSVGSSALTIAYKTRANATASAADPISVAMRNATIATGDFNVRNITGASSLVVPSTATLGHTSAVAGDLYHYLIDNAGTLEPAVSMEFMGFQGIVSTTTIAAASNSASTMYSTTGRSNVAFRCVGHTIDTQATAGTWASVPSTAELETFGQVSGSWTPVLTFATPGNLAVTYSVQVGRYVRHNRKVSATCNITTSAFTHTTASGLLQVTGLPFNSVTTTSVVSYGSASFQGITKASYTQVTPEVNPNSATVLFGASGSAQTFSGVAAADMPTGGSVILRFSLTYII